MRKVPVVAVLIPLLIAFVAGCSILKEPEWSENFALDAESTIPEMTDGSMYSSEKTQPPAYVRGERPDDSRFTDVIVTLKEPQDIRKIVLRRRPDDVVAVDVNVFVMDEGDWQLISDATRGAIAEDVDISVRARAQKIRIRTQRATRTAKGKAALMRSTEGGAGRRAQMERILREPITLAEVEIYGIKPEVEAEGS